MLHNMSVQLCGSRKNHNHPMEGHRKFLGDGVGGLKSQNFRSKV